MRRYFLKKYVFAFVFLGCLLVFSVVNFIHSADNWHELFADLLKIRSVAELEAWIANVDTEANETMLGRENFIETYGYTQKLLGKREFNSFSDIKDDDGMLYYGSTWDKGTDDLAEYAVRIHRLNDYVENRGAKLLVVLPPSKILPNLSTVNRAWPINDPNPRMDRLLNLLQQYGVASLDLRSTMLDSGKSLEDLFFKTDHHWTPLAAFYSVQRVVDVISEYFGDDWDPDNFYTDLNNYNCYTYQDCMLGSNGRDNGVVYSGVEDYTILWPKFPTSFTWINYEKKNEPREGDFTQALLNVEELSISSWYGSSANRVYLQEIVNHDGIINHDNKDGPKLKVLRDSYFSAMACFLAPMCSEIEMQWTRAGGDYDSEAFVREGEYDYLILEVYPYNLDHKSFNFFLEPDV